MTAYLRRVYLLKTGQNCLRNFKKERKRHYIFASKLFRYGSQGDCLGLLHLGVNELTCTTVFRTVSKYKWFVWDSYRCCYNCFSLNLAL